MNSDGYQSHRPAGTAQHRFHGHHIIPDQVGQGKPGVVWRELEKFWRRTRRPRLF